VIEDGKIKFKLSDRTFNEIASEVAISGPSPDDFFHITFLIDRFDLVSQTATKVEDKEETYELSFDSEDSVLSRMKVGTCALTQRAYYGLFAAIIDRAKKQGNLGKITEILASRGVLGGSAEEG
jgi:hypothetical protein